MKKVVILGSGESGTGAALLAKQVGCRVFVSDKGQIQPGYKKQLELAGIDFEEGQHTESGILQADVVIKSPGIAEKVDIVQKIRARGIPIVGEIEWAFQHAGRATWIAITGTNGKTTTTRLIHHLCQSAQLPARLCGNVGFSAAQYVAEDLAAGRTGDASRLFVCEVSSFQLDDCTTFRPNIAVLLNITPDHLDRYDDKLENYVRSKFSITSRQTPDDVFIYNAFDPLMKNWMQQPDFHTLARKMGIRKPEVTRLGKSDLLKNSRLRGPHNHFNAAVARRVLHVLGVPDEMLATGFSTFAPPPHRMEVVAQKAGITWINDSKATNVDAVFYALQAMDSPTIWIAGGIDKGNDYTPLLRWVRTKVKAIVCLGADNQKLFDTFLPLGKPMTAAKSADEAVHQALMLAQPGDTVLLSPACASFDLFNNYEDRGEQFKNSVLQHI